MIQEAGGVTRDIEAVDLLAETNTGLDVMKRSFFVAATPELAKELLEVIAGSGATTEDSNKRAKTDSS